MRDTNPLYDQLRELGISRSYASEVANGHRKPSLDLALRMYERFTVKIGQLADKTENEIETLKAAADLLETPPCMDSQSLAAGSEEFRS